MRFDAVVIPRGAEARAVVRGWRRPQPRMLFVPAGGSAGAALQSDVPIATALVMGLCGALDPVLRVGRPVVYADVVDEDRTIVLDASLAGACATALRCAIVRAANVPAVVGDVAVKAALRSATGAAAVDMEAAAIARTLHARGVRVAMVRVVSDDAVTPLPDLRGIYDAGGALRPLALALALLRTPVRGALFIGHVVSALSALRLAAARLSAHAGPAPAQHRTS